MTVDGSVGTLRFDRSTRADLVAANGPPEAVVQGSFEAPNWPDYLALGYQCSPTDTPNRRSLSYNPSPPYCQTVYYLNNTTGRLGAFWTASPTFKTARGTTVGMTAAEAQRREGQPETNGCVSGIYIGNNTDSTRILLWIQPADSAAPSASDPVTHIDAESSNGGVGLLFC